tara:strand:+ start:569 stop:838 length:270 start_codon:yes stop_codon:yes gene_type:complete
MKKIKYNNLGWACFSLIAAILIHLFASPALFVQAWKYVALLGFIINLSQAFNIKIPYIMDNKKLPKIYSTFAIIIFGIIYLGYLILFQK